MAYSNVQDFRDHYCYSESDELAELDDRPIFDDLRINSGIAKADSEINAILAVAYQVPIVPTPPYLNWASVCITRKILTTHHVDKDGKIRQDYDDVFARLREFVSGNAVLVGADGKPIAKLAGAIGGPDAEKMIKQPFYSGNRMVYNPFTLTQRLDESEREPLNNQYIKRIVYE